MVDRSGEVCVCKLIVSTYVGYAHTNNHQTCHQPIQAWSQWTTNLKMCDRNEREGCEKVLCGMRCEVILFCVRKSIFSLVRQKYIISEVSSGSEQIERDSQGEGEGLSSQASLGRSEAGGCWVRRTTCIKQRQYL